MYFWTPFVYALRDICVLFLVWPGERQEGNRTDRLALENRESRDRLFRVNKGSINESLGLDAMLQGALSFDAAVQP